MFLLAKNVKTRVRDSAKAVLLAAMVAVAAAVAAHAQSYTVDPDSSRQLTDYLKKSRLPLVGAQVMHTDAGDRQVMLYGFVATNFGKTDAEKKTRKFLKDSEIEIVNRIEVRPEIRNLKPKTARSANPQPTADQWDRIMREMREENQTNPP
jgi:hypothetical protein